MSTEQMYLDGTYLEKNPDFHVADSAWKAGHILRMLERNKLQPSTVCEVGCGAGEILNVLHGQLTDQTQFVGYDISPQAYELAKSRGKERLAFFCQDLLSTDISPVDLLLCIDVFEHVGDYLGFLSVLRTKAKYKLFHIPLDLSALSLLRIWQLIRQRKKLGHLHYFCKESALMTLEDTGYEIVDWFYTAVDQFVSSKGHAPKRPLLQIFRRFLRSIDPDFEVRALGGYAMMVLTT